MGIGPTICGAGNGGANFDVEAPTLEYFNYKGKVALSDTSPMVAGHDEPIWPARRSAIAAESPPMPPPITTTLSCLKPDGEEKEEREESMRKCE